MLILISDPFDASLPHMLTAYGEVTEDKGKLADADVVLVRSKTKCTKEYIDAAKNLKLIIRGGVGLDNVDIAYAESKGILVRNTPKASAIAVAELAFALMISVPTNLIEVHNGMKRGEWLKKMRRTELYGKTLALIGMGNIATKLAERAVAFGMRVVAYDKYVKGSPIATMMESPEEAVQDADYISLHLPLTDETKGLVCYRLIDACNKAPVLINTGRGLCVDADCVVKALREGKLSWYATDVYPSDPPAADYPLLKCDRVTLTPHIGANSEENLLRIGEEVLYIIDELVKGGKL
ncbi:MAG TPA: NAD(P)-dependent oxidoreductase [Sphaerochaetaceae bacterium]|nr:NAD(P)-dependent oxidoreductase [Sphaerochaetaceae bacterium]